MWLLEVSGIAMIVVITCTNMQSCLTSILQYCHSNALHHIEPLDEYCHGCRMRDLSTDYDDDCWVSSINQCNLALVKYASII